MTCIEKLKSMHPDWHGATIAMTVEDECPVDHMAIAIPTTENGETWCAENLCDKCWNREVPDTDQTAPAIKDSGERRQFDTGAVRDIQEGKGRCDLMPLDVVGEYMEDPIPLFIGQFQSDGIVGHLYGVLREAPARVGYADHATMFLEVSKHFEEGAKKYGENNWQKGIPVRCYIDSAIRHYLKLRRGDNDEPHDRAFCWNIICAIWTCKHMPNLNDYKEN